MFNRADKRVNEQLKRLSERLAEENPLLKDIVGQFQRLDRLAYRMGLLGPEQSYAFTISWWPMVAVLGTFSAGKSSFINAYLGQDVQRTGNQAVDDHFTVICYGASDAVKELPGVALDGDPRFPFYRVSDEIARVGSDRGRSVDHYLKMKTCRAEPLRGRILIDSPGFDADEQRTEILRLTDHIIDLSDLVLVFFDARHPEPGAMRDTLEYLVSRVAERNDAGKLMFILNQIDTTWHEDNLEEVVSAWQRAVVRKGSDTGRFYCIYNPQQAVRIEEPLIEERYRQKAGHDRDEIHQRIAGVTLSRSYRIVGSLQAMADRIEQQAVPALCEALARWSKRVALYDGLAYAALAAVVLAATHLVTGSVTVLFQPGWIDYLAERPMTASLVGAGVIAILGAIHYTMRRTAARQIARQMATEQPEGNLQRAFLKNTRFWHSLWRNRPTGWGRSASRLLRDLRENAEGYVQRLNNAFVDPVGRHPEGEAAHQATSVQQNNHNVSEGSNEERSTGG